MIFIHFKKFILYLRLLNQFFVALIKFLKDEVEFFCYTVFMKKYLYILGLFSLFPISSSAISIAPAIPWWVLVLQFLFIFFFIYKFIIFIINIFKGRISLDKINLKINSYCLGDVFFVISSLVLIISTLNIFDILNANNDAFVVYSLGIQFIIGLIATLVSRKLIVISFLAIGAYAIYLLPVALEYLSL